MFSKDLFIQDSKPLPNCRLWMGIQAGSHDFILTVV